jgi:hypothetical protein
MPKPTALSYARPNHIGPTRSGAPIWNSHAMVIIAGAISALALALVYSGPAASVVLLRLITDGLYLLSWLLAGLGFGALVIEWRGPACPSRAVPMVGLLYVVTGIALGLGLMSLCILGLGLTGLLTRAAAFGLLALGILAGAFAILLHSRRRKAARGDEGRSESASSWWRGRAGWAWAGLVVAPWLALALVGTMMVPGLLWKPGEPHGYDVVEYHLQAPREWYEAGRIVPLRHNAFSFFPFNVETHYLLAMHLEGGPYEGMYLCQLMHLAIMVLVVLATWAFARRIAPSRGAAVVAGVAVAVVPWVAQLAAIAYNEGGFLLYSTLAVGWAMLAIRDSEGRARKFVIAGVMAGLACGAKLTAVPEVLIGVPVVAGVVLLLVRRAWAGDPEAPVGRLRRDLAGLVLFVVAGLVVFAPWLTRNLVWVGNPVFPEGASVLGRGYFSDVQVERWHRAHSPQPEQRPVGARLRAFGGEVLASWQFAYVLVPLGVVGMFVARRRPENLFLAGMLLLLTVFWLGFTHLQGRFYLLALPVCAIAAAQIEWPRMAIPVVLLVIVAATVPGWLRVHRTILARLYGEPGSPAGGMVSVLGGPLKATENVSWITIASTERLPEGARLLLVGDAKAFWYPIPMSRLRYRTVFDADTSNGRGIDEAWGVTAAREAGEWVLIDPQELQRLEQTYQPFPPLPTEWTSRPEWAAGHPFLLPPVQGSGRPTSPARAP